MTIPLIHTTLPTPPSTTDSANFDQRGDAFLAALPTFQGETNAVIAGVNSAAADIDAALAALASTKWVSGTTYAVGAAVWSPVDYLTYRRKTAGAGATDPSIDSTNWALAMARVVPGLCNVQSSASSMTLAANSKRLQVLSFTQPFRHVMLPAPMAGMEGSDLYRIKNAGKFSFDVRSSANVLLARLDPGMSTSIGLVDAASNTWTSSYGHIPSSRLIEVIDTVSASTFFIAYTPLTSTKTIALYYSTSLYMVVLSESGGVLTAGTPVLVSGASANFAIETVSTTQAIILYRSGANLVARAVTISGTTPSLPGAEFTVQSGSSAIAINCVRLTSSTIAVSYSHADLNRLKVLSISGSTVTGGTEIGITSSGNRKPVMRLRSATELLVAFTPVGSTDIARVATFTIAGTTSTSIDNKIMLDSLTGTFMYYSIELLSDDTLVLIAASVSEGFPVEVAYAKNSGLMLTDIRQGYCELISAARGNFNTIKAANDRITAQFQAGSLTNVATLEFNGYGLNVIGAGCSHFIQNSEMANFNNNKNVVLGKGLNGYPSAHICEGVER